MEMVGPSKRLHAGVICQFFFTTGYILTAGFAYFIKDWRILQAALSAPGILFLCYWWYAHTHTQTYALNTGWHHIFDAQTQVSAQGSAILMEGLDYVPQSLQQNDGIVLRL